MKINKLIMALLVFSLMIGAASADTYYGGLPLSTVEEGTVSGGVYTDSFYGILGQVTGANTITKAFTVPSFTNIKSAMLLTTVYVGNMQNNYPLTANTTFNGNVLGNETLNVDFTYMINGGNNNSAFAGHGTNESYKIVNDHVNRVTSDYTIWYNVTNLVSPGSNSATVQTALLPNGTDGRIKLITLIVAYNDGSTKQIHYWINRGHDYIGSLEAASYTASTTFAGSIGAIQNAALTSVYAASTDANYNFSGNIILRTLTPQGSQGGSNTWDVTSLFNPSGPNNMTYSKFGTSYKIVLGILQEQAPGALSISANPTIVTAGIPTDVTFTVTSNGTAVSGAAVNLIGSATGNGTTDANGSTKISVNATGAGTITATASKTGYTTGTATLTVSAKHTGVSSSVSLGASIIPAISLVVTPDAIDFGKLSPGQTSSAYTLTLSNTGGHGISVTTDVNDTANNLFVNGLLLDSNAWGTYSASIVSGGSKPAGASLKVPGDYAGVGAQNGTLVFWGEAK